MSNVIKFPSARVPEADPLQLADLQRSAASRSLYTRTPAGKRWIRDRQPALTAPQYTNAKRILDAWVFQGCGSIASQDHVHGAGAAQRFLSELAVPASDQTPNRLKISYEVAMGCVCDVLCSVVEAHTEHGSWMWPGDAPKGAELRWAQAIADGDVRKAMEAWPKCRAASWFNRAQTGGHT